MSRKKKNRGGQSHSSPTPASPVAKLPAPDLSKGQAAVAKQQPASAKPTDAYITVEADICRPVDGAGAFNLFRGAIQLPPEVLNCIYNAALAATPNQTGDILTISLKVVHPDAETILATLRKRPAQFVPANQPTLLPDEDDPDMKDEYADEDDELDETFDPDTVDLEDEYPDEDDEEQDENDLIQELYSRLAQSTSAPLRNDLRMAFAIDLYELAMAWDVKEDPDSILIWFRNYLEGIYQRLMKLDRFARDSGACLNLASNIVGTAEEYGINIANSERVWSWVQFNCRFERDKSTGVPVLVLSGNGEQQAAR